jgi:hypothetical protein
MLPAKQVAAKSPNNTKDKEQMALFIMKPSFEKTD